MLVRLERSIVEGGSAGNRLQSFADVNTDRNCESTGRKYRIRVPIPMVFHPYDNMWVWEIKRSRRGLVMKKKDLEISRKKRYISQKQEWFTTGIITVLIWI